MQLEVDVTNDDKYRGKQGSDRITAQVKDGVLTLQVPKRAEAQPRKIEIRVG